MIGEIHRLYKVINVDVVMLEVDIFQFRKGDRMNGSFIAVEVGEVLKEVGSVGKAVSLRRLTCRVQGQELSFEDLESGKGMLADLLMNGQIGSQLF